MTLKDKYAKLLEYAQNNNIRNLSVEEKNNVLYVSGSAPVSVKDHIWDMYNQIDPDMRAGDMVLNIQVISGAEEVYEVKSGDNLSKIASKYPGITWQKIYDANKDMIKNPDMIHPGLKLRIPL